MYPDIYRVMRICVAATSLLASLPVGAQNLLQNPGFATSLDPWEPFGGFGQTTVWSSFDAANDPNSGSAFGTIPADSSFRVPPYASQCVVIEPNTTYVYGGKAFMPSATTSPDATSFADVEFYPNTGCFGNNDLFQFAPHVSTHDAWMQILDVATTLPSDLSVRINMYVYAPTGITMQSDFDDMFLMPDAIFRSGFE